MIKTRTRKILRDILSRKFRTLMVSTSIFVGVLGVVALFTTRDLLISTLENDIQLEKLAMIKVMVTAPNDVELDNDAYVATLNQETELGQSLPALDGVETVEGTALFSVAFKKPGAESYEDGYLSAYSVPLQDRQLEPMTLTDGTWPVAAQNQIALEKRMAKEFGYHVGDTIVLRTVSAAGLSEAEYTVTGLVYHAYFDNDVMPEERLYVQFPDVENIVGVSGYNGFAVRYATFAQAEANFKAFQQVINEQTPYFPVYALMEDPAESRAISNTENTGNVLSMLAMVTMIVAGFLVVNVVNSIVVEQKRQIGVMKSMGATGLDNFRMYAGIALMYGVIGMIPGVLLGFPAGYALAKVTAPLLPVLIESFELAPFVPAIVIGVLMGTLMPLLAALLPVLLGTRVTILEAMSDFGISARFGRGIVSRLIGRLPLPVTMRQAFANIYQKKGRLLMTLITLTLAAGAFMGVAAVFMSLGNKLTEIYETYNTDLAVNVIAPDDYDYAAVGALIADELPDLDGVYPIYAAGIDIVLDEDATVVADDGVYWVWTTGFNPAERTIQPHLKSGAGWQSDPERGGVVITSLVADAIGKGVGDVITLRLDDRTLDVEIIGLDEFPSNDNAFMQLSDVMALADATRPNLYWVRFADDISGADVDRQSGVLREGLLRHGIIASFNNIRAQQEENVRLVTTIAMVFNIASLVMAAVGAIGLLTMLFISVFERQREIGVMRSVGASSGTVALQFLTEGVLIGMVAWVIGLPVSYLLGNVLTRMLPVSDFGFKYPPLAAGIGAAGMAVIATLASLWPSLSAARRTVSDILRYQ